MVLSSLVVEISIECAAAVPEGAYLVDISPCKKLACQKFTLPHVMLNVFYHIMEKLEQLAVNAIIENLLNHCSK